MVTNHIYAENSSTIGNTSISPNEKMNKNVTRMMSQDNDINLTGNFKSKSNNLIDSELQFNNNNTLPNNTTFANITGGSSGTALSSVAIGDFNGDGFDDKAIGVPDEDVLFGGSNFRDAGIVQVIYGSPRGLDASDSAVIADQLWHEGTLGLDGILEELDWFGTSLSSGDYNDDGKGDLAIGVIGQKHNQILQAGAVHVIYGSQFGLSTSAARGDQLFIQDGFGEVPEAHDRFGWSLASGDYNGDGRDDLAIGTPFQKIGSLSRAGVVQVVYSSQSASGLDALFNTQIFGRGMINTGNFDHFGWALASGDYNGDGRDDLAIGVPNGQLPSVDNSGAVRVIYGSPGGLTETVLRNQFWTQGSGNLDDVAETWDKFGHSLSSGDYNGDGKDDLAIGVPWENIQGETISRVGKVHVIYGSTFGLSSTSPIIDQLWQQGLGGLDDVAELNDSFGDSLSSGDYNGDGKDDLAIGVPTESIAGETIKYVGKMHVIYGSSSGLSTTSPISDQLWQQGLNGLDEIAEINDRFGASLSSGDYNGDGKDDLAIGAPWEKIVNETIEMVGKIHVVYGSSSGLSTTSPIADQLWQQGLNGLDDVAEVGDVFGTYL